MSDCNCNQNKASSNEDHLPNYAVEGFASSTSPDNFDDVRAQLVGVDAVAIQSCVTGTYNPSTHQLCFKAPIIGTKCVTVPSTVPLPAGAVKVCIATCGTIPCGAKVTAYLNNSPVYTTKFGCC
ncbi:hypothetical protein [Acidovorax sp. PRC11]|uniref:hypothetical protein n=1 Tax=Acidovorax sp. PRC11 TaxID=2962592 RepID=UPI002881310C|nr:hypothetical protein [Acidovorax sp. PRC11]MDT0136238.1 hypothetical protein [Acidovorax sp. PRC11]